MSTVKLVYWDAKSRGWPAAVLAHFGGVPLLWDKETANTWPAPKALAPFGQLPYIEVDGHHYAQSGAIYRIIARRAGLEGGSDHEFALTQQLIEEYQDIYGVLSKNLYIKDDAARAAAWEESLKDKLPLHLGYLEKLVGANGQFSPNRLLAGDVLIICALQIVTEVQADALDKFPKVKAFFEKHRAAVLGEYAKTPAYVVKK